MVIYVITQGCYLPAPAQGQYDARRTNRFGKFRNCACRKFYYI